MEYAVLNSSFCSIACKGEIIFQSHKSLGENLVDILSKNIVAAEKIKKVYLCSGPGSLIASRSLISFFLGMNIYNNFQIYYIDSLRDILLGSIMDGIALFPITLNRFIVGYKNKGIYSYEFKDIDEVLKILQSSSAERIINIDQNIGILQESTQNLLLSYCDRVIHWDSKDLFHCKVEESHLKSMVNYSFW